MTTGDAIARLAAGQPVYRWNDFRQCWSRVLGISYDRATRRHMFSERIPTFSDIRRLGPPGPLDRLAANLPTSSAGGICSKYRPSRTKF